MKVIGRTTFILCFALSLGRGYAESLIFAQGAVTGGGGCYFGECEGPETQSPPPNPQPQKRPPPPRHGEPQSPPPAYLHEIQINNRCQEKVDVAVRVLTLRGEWRNYYWFRIEPQTLTVLDHDGIPIRSDNDIVYYYAEAVDSDRKWTGSKRHFINNDYYYFRERDIPEDDEGFHTIPISCRTNR